jgi:hypothetical protein
MKPPKIACKAVANLRFDLPFKLRKEPIDRGFYDFFAKKVIKTYKYNRLLGTARITQGNIIPHPPLFPHS